MPRLPRVYIENILYYVTSKSSHSQGLFIDANDYHEYISLIDKYKRQYGFKLFSYVLLPTHLHMLVELKNNIHISSIMHDINSLYTKVFNNRYNKKGHHLQERFKALLAEKEPYLLPLTRHIHLSPKRAGIVRDPKDYPYSSHMHFIDPAKRQFPDMSEEVEEIFGRLKGREIAFGEYVTNASQGELDDLAQMIHKRRILGSKAFAEEVKRKIEEAEKKQKMKPIPKKLRILYITAGSAAILFFAVIAGFFYRQTTALKTEYDKTLALYTNTLKKLREERQEAVTAMEDVEKYDWKIRLAEKAVEELKVAQAEAVKAGQEIDGYGWDIKLTQMGNQTEKAAYSDLIYFKNGVIHSSTLEGEGFSGTIYSLRMKKNGNLVWETMQRNDAGDTAGWHGEWDGRTMRGVLSRRSHGAGGRDFSFVSVSERLKR